MIQVTQTIVFEKNVTHSSIVGLRKIRKADPVE